MSKQKTRPPPPPLPHMNYLLNYCNKQLPIILTYFLLGCYVTLYTHHPLHSILSMSFLNFYSYFIHYGCHLLPEEINLHAKYHHVVHSDWWEKMGHLAIETAVNIGFFAILYGLQLLLQMEVIPTSLLFYYGTIYVSIHIINYSLCHASPKHVIHHLTSVSVAKPEPEPETKDETDRSTTTSATTTPTPTCTTPATKNYGPDIIDHLFGTNDDETFEDFNHMIPNILVAFFLTWYLFTPRNGPDPSLAVVPFSTE
jgi:hypothetical protein